jgi:hypothetical protein
MTSTAVFPSRLRAIAGWALVVLAAMLPFESVRPLARVGPLQISSTELFLYAAVGIWLLARAMSAVGSGIRWQRPSPGHVGAAVWIAALGLAAVCAPVMRGAAGKFFLRSLGGVALFAAAADLLRDARLARRTAIGLTIGAVVAALAAVGEVHVPAVAGAIRLFHPRTFDVLGVPRASGTFQFPNIAAMYFEAVVPLAIAVGVSGTARRGGGNSAAILVPLTLLYALALTASRAGLATAGVALVVLAVVARRPSRMATGALVSLGGLVAFTIILQMTGSALGLRQRFWEDDRWYRSSITPAAIGAPGAVPASLEADGAAQVALVLRNEGTMTWRAEGPLPVVLAYRWIDDAREARGAFDGAPIPLPRDLAPGAAMTVNVTIRAPSRPGSYALWWDLARPDVASFSEPGDPRRRQHVEVTPSLANLTGREGAAAPPAPKPVPSSEASRAPVEISRRLLWRAAFAAFREHPLFGLGPDNFRHQYGGYVGVTRADDRFHANSLYLETLANEGIVGMIALVVLALALAQAARRAATAGSDLALAIGGAVAIGTYFVHGLVDYFFEFTPTYGLFWLLAGMLVALGRDARARM